MSSGYAVAPIFLIRLAGVPFDAIAALSTPHSIRLARKLTVCRLERANAKAELDRAYQAGERLVSNEASRNLRIALRANRAPAAVADPQPEIVSRFTAAANKVEATERELDLELEREVNVARGSLIEWSRRVLPRYLVFASTGVRDSLLRELADYPVDPADLLSRRNNSRKTEQSLLLYLQRVAAKNDTFSEFGPGGWGAINSGERITLRPQPGIAAQEVFFERWVSQSIVDLINADPYAAAELPLGLNPNGGINGDKFVFYDSGEHVPLTPDQVEVLENCQSERPFHVFAEGESVIAELAARNILRRGLRMPALDAHSFEVLLGDVEKWRDGPARRRWLPTLRGLDDLRLKFELTQRPNERVEILDRVRSDIDQLGGGRKSAQRFLYSASNPIGEECLRDCGFCISSDLAEEVATEAAPWIDLWRDSYAFIASRVAAGLRRVFERASGGADTLAMPAFLRACEEARLSLTGPGLVALAVMAFQEVKAAVRQRLLPHADDDEYELTLDDCRVVRQKFDYPKFDEYTYPSADLQLSAESLESVGRGRYDWIVSELHPPVAVLHHGVYWSCPDQALLNEAFARSAGGKPSFHFGFFAADFTAHTTVRMFDALPHLSYFVAPQRSRVDWQTVRPAEADVFVDGATGDVGLRERRSEKYLGSFARNWVIPLGFHPFQFGLPRHTPRLRCGRAIVQRRAWTVTRDDLPGNYSGISRDLLTAVDRLRADKNLPRYVYIRPSEQALRRSGAEGRDKDTKPVFVDLESYLFHEVLYKWLAKAGELEITEMLPDPDHLLWTEADGKRTFELRTLIVPRS